MLSIERVDPDATEQMSTYAEISIESEKFGVVYPTSFTLEEQREELRNADSSVCVEGYLGLDDDRPVCTGTIALFLTDNVEKTWIFVNTLPELRRRGHGSAMLEFLVERAKAEGRSTLLTGARYPFDADESHHDRHFLTERGFSLANAEVHRIVDLPVDATVLDRLWDESLPHWTDYTLVDFEGLVPDAMREAYCVLLNQIIVDAPSGTVDFEEGCTTPENLVEREESSQAAGRTTYITVALDGAGVPVAHNILQVPATDPGPIFNQDTMVLRAHRGHRLGYATKIRNLRRVAALHPDRTILHTWNAESNAPMIALNDAMGFRPVTYGGEYVRHL